MGNVLKEGMEFKNMIELCKYINWKYDYKHSPRINRKLRKYIEFHREERNKIIIDKIISNEILEQYKNRNFDYVYEINDIVDVKSGKIQILDKTYINTKSSKRRAYKCKCLNDKCGYEYIDYEYNVTKGIGCGCCNGKIVVNGINDLNTTNPEISKLLLNYEDGFKYTKNSGQSLDWKCPICGKIHKDKKITNISKVGLSCNCSKTKSYPNRFMHWLLINLNIHFEEEKTFCWSNNRKYDFYLSDFNIIIEMMGKQHYEKCSFTTRTLEEEQINDDYKNEIAIDNGIKKYICIDCTYSDFNYIKNNVLNSDLNNVINFKMVDWDFVQVKSETNILNEIAKYWNDGIYDTKLIGEKVGLTSSPVVKHLKKCEQFGLIEKFDKEKINKQKVKKIVSTYYQHYAKPMQCIENDLVFGSMALTQKTMSELTNLKFNTTNIIGTTTGRYSHHHHYTFKYITRKEFNEIKRKSPELTYGDFFIDETDCIKEKST